jgi:hypothetical protein
MPIYRGEKMAMSLFSPMIGNSVGVKANNSFCMMDELRFCSSMLNICGGTEILQFGRRRKRRMRRTKNAVCGSGKLARPRTRPITLMVARWYRIRRRILAVFWQFCLGRIGNVMCFLFVFRQFGPTL